MKIIFSGLVLFCFAACNNNAPATNGSSGKDSIAIVSKNDSANNYIYHVNDTTLENRITAELMKLPFVKKADTYIDSFSNHQHGMAFMLDSLDKKENEIYVQAGYNGDLRFETYFHFYVNPQTMEIKVLDVVNDKKLSVKEYLKTQH